MLPVLIMTTAVPCSSTLGLDCLSNDLGKENRI
jgi:hypothetical protein